MESLILFLLPFVATVVVVYMLVIQSRQKVRKTDIQEYIKDTEITKQIDTHEGMKTAAVNSGGSMMVFMV